QEAANGVADILPGRFHGELDAGWWASVMGGPSEILKFSLDNRHRAAANLSRSLSNPRRHRLMQERSVIHSTFVIERTFSAKPERVFAAFSNPAKKREWYVDRKTMDFEGFEMDFRAGGLEHAVFRFKEGSPFPGKPLVYDTTYQEIVANQRIVTAYRI